MGLLQLPRDVGVDVMEVVQVRGGISMVGSRIQKSRRSSWVETIVGEEGGGGGGCLGVAVVRELGNREVKGPIVMLRGDIGT
jgi:hypothetical protein